MASYSEVKKFIYKFFGVSDSVSEDSKVIEGTAIRVAKRLNTLAENYPDKTVNILFNDIIVVVKEEIIML